MRPRDTRVLTRLIALLCLIAPGSVAAAAPIDQVAGPARWLPAGEAELSGRAASDGAYPAGAAPWLLDLAGRVDLRLGARNLGASEAACSATLRSTEGEAIVRIPFAVASGSIGFADELSASVLAPDAAQVTCDQPFEPVAVARGGAPGQTLVAKASGPNGSCHRWIDPVRLGDGSYEAVAPGLLHEATKATPKGIVCLRLPAAMRFGKAVFEWDFLAGPWYPKRPTGIHNLGYIFTERYRAGVLGNVNAVNKSAVKFMQNYDMPLGSNSNRASSYEVRRDVIYHVTYTFDARNRGAMLQLFAAGNEVKRLSQEIHPIGNVLALRPYGKGSLDGLALVVEFGNYEPSNPVEIPEVPTFGWLYGNLRIRLLP